MQSAILSTLVIAVLLYAASTTLFLAHLLSKKLALAKAGLIVLVMGMGGHALSLVLKFSDVGVLPATDPLGALGFFSLVVGVVFAFVARRYGVPVLGAFATPLCLVTAAAALAFGGAGDGVIPEALRSRWFPLHLGFAITGDALFAVAGAAALAYLIQSRLLQKKRLGAVFQKLPPLHVLDEIVHRLIVVGWACLSIGMVAGAFFAKQEWGAYWSWDPKQTWALVTWLLFAGILHMRYVVGWQGRRTAMMTVVTVVLMLLAFVFLQEIFGGKHGGTYT